MLGKRQHSEVPQKPKESDLEGGDFGDIFSGSSEKSDSDESAPTTSKGYKA